MMERSLLMRRLLWVAAMFLVSAEGAWAQQAEMPRAVDERLKIDLFAADPDIVTPTGIAVDARGRVFVAESHTHFPPENYDGPKTDRIRVFEDADGDGKAEKISTFFEGNTATMNVAIAPDGSLLVATRMEVMRLRDRDDDGRADETTRLAGLETAGDYPHNGISGFAFDPLGYVYFGMGENLGKDYTLIGSDGVTLSGGGEGGNIFRMRPDGSQLERIATGFWNPFHVCIDAFGRLFAVDNDPDSRPPCRLLHIVPGGDYGYRYRNGRKGLHPFTAWNGELPGTLPMTAGVGEAPSGLTAYESDNLPADYVGELLVTSWGDHRLERHRLSPHGASFRTKSSAFVVGGENFRPVGVAVGPDGALYVSDWVDKSYTLHKKGRVWKISAKDASVQRPPFDPPKANIAKLKASLFSTDRATREIAAAALYGKGDVGRATLGDVIFEKGATARVRTAAIGGLWQGTALDDELSAAKRAEALQVLGLRFGLLAGLKDEDALLLMRMSLVPLTKPEQRQAGESLALLNVQTLANGGSLESGISAIIAASLGSQDPFIRQAARHATIQLGQAGTLGRKLLESEDARLRLEGLLMLRDSADPSAKELLPVLLVDADPDVKFAAIQWVAEKGLVDYRPLVEQALTDGTASRKLFEGALAAIELLNGIRREQKDEIGGDDYVAQLLVKPDSPLAVRRRGLRMVRPDHPALTLDWLSSQLQEDDEVLQLEALRTLRERAEPQAREIVARIAADPDRDETLRAEALVGVSSGNPKTESLLVDLAIDDFSPTIRDEALRSLHGASLPTDAVERLKELARKEPHTAELVSRATKGSPFERPANADVDAWLALLNERSRDAAAGERVFFSSLARCSACHQRNGRGGKVGPDLTTTGRQLDRRRLVESLLLPSKEIAPQFAGYSVETVDGRTFQGLLVREDVNGVQAYMDANGQVTEIHLSEVAQRSPQQVSLMPENLPRSLTLQELSDLVEFLQQEE